MKIDDVVGNFFFLSVEGGELKNVLWPIEIYELLIW